MTSSQHNYLLMRSALEKFGKAASELEPEALEQAHQMASRALQLQQLVLKSPEAIQVQLPDSMLSEALTQLRQRFDSDKAYREALKNNQLNEEGLKLALKDELISEAVLETVGNSIPLMSEAQAREYYETHADKFEQPERRYAHHILITVNPDFKENTEEQVIARIQAIHQDVTTETFGAQAIRYSECPSAMNEGELGWVEAGLLFPELDKKLFEMAEGEISAPIVTEIGYHILFCQQVKDAHKVPFDEACEKIIQSHQQKLKIRAQKLWFQQLNLPQSA